jgi:hypothetical protein
MKNDHLRDDFIWLFNQGVLQAASPCNPQFSVDVDDIDPRGDCLPQIFIIGSRSAVQGEQNPSRTVEDDRVKSSLCSLHCLREGMRMICVEKNWEIEFLRQCTKHSH